MKRIVTLLTLFAISFILFPVSNAARNPADGAIRSYRDIPGVTEKEISEVELLIEQRGGFTYGHLLETEAFLLPDGSFAGFTIELCKLLSDLFETEFTPKNFADWPSMKAALDNMEVDFSGGFTRTEERLNVYYMTGPIAGRSLNLHMLKDSAVSSEQELNGARIGTLYGSALLDAVIEHYPGFSFEQVDLSNYAEGVALLESFDIDAVLATSAADFEFFAYDTITAKEFFSLAYYPVSVAAADPSLAPLISIIDKYITAGGYEKIFELYAQGEFEYKKNRLFMSFTEEELSYLDKMVSGGEKVNIGLQHDAYPASFYNDTEREYQGVSIDILKEITRLTGLEFEPLSTSETTPLATILEKLKSGEISMMTQLLKTESRKNDYIWSEVPYLKTNYALLSRMDYPDVEIYQIPWENVGTVNKSAHEVMFDTWFPDHQNRTVYNTTHEAFDALENGKIDLLMLSENMLLQQTNLRQNTRIKVNVKLDVSLDSFFGFSKNESVLRSVADKSMAYINIGRIADNWMNKIFDYESELTRVRSVYILCIAAVMLVALIALALLFLKNKRLDKSLSAHTTKLSTIYKSIPDTVFSKDVNGTYTSCNPSFEAQAGLREEEIVGKTYAEVFGERITKTAELYHEIDKRILREGITNIVEEEVIFPDGSRRVLETLKAPLIQNGAVVGIIGMGRDVTERKEIKSRLDRIINTAQVAFILTINGIITEANQYCKEYVGMRIGDDIRQFYADPEQRDRVIELTERYGTLSNYVINIKIANDRIHRFLVSITQTEYEQRRAHIVWALDIEEDEQRSDLLRETQLSFQMVLDTLPMPTRIVDMESREIVYVNSSLLELLEYDSPNELCGRQIRSIVQEILSDGTPSAEREALVIAESDRPVAVDMEYLTKSGKVIEAVVAARVIDYKGRRSSLGIIKDLTEEKRMAQILRDSAEREKEANQAKSLFLANMSHEIRTPMNGIIGMTDLLLNENLAERQRQYAKDIKASAESLLSIINDILDLSKITEGKLQITPVDIDLSTMLKNTVSMMRFSAQSKGLSFVDDVRTNVPEYVRVDDVRLNQIIINLLSNAIKFTKKGRVKFTVKLENGNIVIEVNDTGIGIKEDEIPLIFSAFEQADKRKNRSIKGTGLGLSITKNLVKLMNGKIWVESEYEVGSTFYVTIPYVPGDESAVEASGDTSFEYVFAPTAQILLVDDIQTNLTVGTGLLRLCGITADVALSGPEAIEYVKAKDYDIVFMDHMMPEMDGIEAMNIIRGLGGRHLKTPIIALTANAVGESRELLLDSGMDDFLSKPIDKTMLMDILRKWLPDDKIKSIAEGSESGGNTVYSKTLLSASKIDELDIDLALRRIGGLHDVLEQSIKQTAFSIDEKLKRMDACLSTGDLGGFAVDAHGFKGALANIGATKYSELASALEISAKAENTPLCMEKFLVFADVMSEFAVSLKKCFQTPKSSDKPQGDFIFLEAQLIKAVDYLEGFEAADALSCLSEFSVFTFGAELDEKLAKAADAAERFSYDEAIALLKELISGIDQ